MTSRLRQHRRDLGLCSYCPKLCRFACPTAEAERRETVTPWGKMTLAELVRSGGLEADEEVAEIFYHCLGCLHCHRHCRHGVDVPGALVAARRQAWEQGLAPVPGQRFLDNLRAGRSLSGGELRISLSGVPGVLSRVPEAQAVLFPGCRLLEQADSASRHLEAWQALGVDYLALYDGDPLCCGLPFWWAGDLESFTAQARRLAAELRRFRLVVCACPSCAWSLRTLAAPVDADPGAEVLHEVELLARLLGNGQLPRRRLGGAYTMHLPCALVRGLEQVEAANRVLESLFSNCRQPAGWAGDDSFCCGGGGLVPELLPEVGRAIARRRWRQLSDCGGDTVLTCCPGCQQQLQAVAEGKPVRDLFVELAGRLSGE